MGVDADNHLLRLGLAAHAVGPRCLLWLWSAGWPGWADRTVTGRECGRPLLGHGPSGQLLDDAPVSDDRQFNSQDRRSVNLWVRPLPTGTHRAAERSCALRLLFGPPATSWDVSTGPLSCIGLGRRPVHSS